MRLKGIRHPIGREGNVSLAAIGVEGEAPPRAGRARPSFSLNLLSRSRSSLGEGVVAGAVMVAFAFAVYGIHVVRGGFILDDWAFAADHERFGGLASTARHFLDTSGTLMNTGGRLGTAVYFATDYTLFGSNAALHIVVAVLLAALMSTGLFLVLRALGLERLHAAAIALLVLIFPAADAPRFWPSASTSQLAISLYLAGLILALRGLNTNGRSAVAWHAAALACYVASLLTYEITVGGVALTILLYRLRSGWAPSLRRWAVDLATLAVTLVYVKHSKPYGVAFGSLSDRIDRARGIQGQARELLTRVGVQAGSIRLPFLVIVLLVVAAAVAALRLPASSAFRRPLRRWLAIAAGGTVAIGAGYVSFVATDTFYMPLRPGIGNRTNIAAAAGFVVLIYALTILFGYLVALAASFVRTTRPSKVPIAGAVAGVLLAGIGALWLYEIRQDRLAWDRAAALNQQTLTVLRNRLAKPPEGSTIYTFGMPGETAPLVLPFTTSWDLTGAVRLLWHDSSLRGIPGASIARSYSGNTPENSGIACRGDQVQPRGYFYSAADASAYGKTIFVDVPSRRSVIVGDRRTCRAWTARYPGL